MESKILVIGLIVALFLCFKIITESPPETEIVYINPDIKTAPYDHPSPCDRLDRYDVFKLKGGMWINISEFTVHNILNSSSMSPFIESEANAFSYKPRHMQEVCEGDIVTYYRANPAKNKTDHIIHRVTYKGKDVDGYYLILKGDNNRLDDFGKVRFENVTGIVWGVIY